MPIPIGKAFLTIVRFTLRPINNTLIRTFKAQVGTEKKSFGFRFFASCGQFFNRFEVALNRIIIQKKGLGEIKQIPSEAAFYKGVDYFTELMFYYGIMFGICIYEIDKQIKSSNHTQYRLKKVVTD